MIYLLANETTAGYWIVGAFRSRKRAEKLVEALERPDDLEQGNFWHVKEVEAFDGYTDESIIQYVKNKRRKEND